MNFHGFDDKKHKQKKLQKSSMSLEQKPKEVIQQEQKLFGNIEQAWEVVNEASGTAAFLN